ncbi:hypothetical protein REJC140_02564 [Pseudorhizobium endolithicum]|uniref:Transcriptional regulator n=1 Tax=Pseudorhizobium endolithicum TaxID=1191678 RepID=A0ABN7JK44_9HYPH|nr:DUF6516 family protein [Pseudorhizobium endolithicum]CAD7027939.1 hypothetical protein REJC140_02564 [Pseudorhizobium endolithicum]
MAKAVLIHKSRAYIRDGAFIEMLIWRVPENVRGSHHAYKYSLALICNGECVLRFDNEAGKGDHRHFGDRETPYEFSSMDALIADFHAAVRGWLNDHADGEDRES